MMDARKRVAAMMTYKRAGLALLALALSAGCSTPFFEPTPNWWREGGRICAANRDAAGADWRGVAPRSCARGLAEGPVAETSQQAR